MTDREKMIENYIEGYNQFDVNKMVADFDYNIIFKNIQNGVTNISLIGLSEFKEQAEQAKTYFSIRKQTIKSFKHINNETEIDINYFAILGIDLPNGLKKGQELNLEGKSVFKFSGNKITELKDIS
jgi:hypothetical protein